MTENRIKNKIKLGFMVLILSTILGIITYNSFQLGLQTAFPRKYSNIVEDNAELFGVDKNLVYALIETESGFDKNAVSSVGAKGLTQITPETFAWLQSKTGEEHSEDALFQPEISIYYGVFFLDMLLDEFGDMQVAFTAYHAGRGKVNEWLADPRYSSDGKTLERIPYEDTSAYVKKVIKNYKMYNKIYNF